MKRVLKLLVIVFLATVIGGVGEATEVPSQSDILVETVETKQQIPIPLSLPNKARVVLKNGERRSGQVVGMDSQMLTIEKGGSRPSLPLNEIDYVKLEGEFWWPTDDGNIVIRGEETVSTGPQKELLVRIEGFSWEDSNIGTAKILQEAVLEVNGQKRIPRGMQSVIRRGDSRYVVSEIRFESEGELMRITARATSIEED